MPRSEGGVAIIYEKSEQLGKEPYVTGEGEERDENRRLLCGNCGHILANNLGDNVIIQVSYSGVMDAIHITKVLVRNHSLSF